MLEIKYETIKGKSDVFQVMLDTANQITEIRNVNDPYQMNWTSSDKMWGTVKCGHDLSLSVEREFIDHETLAEKYTFRNNTDFDIYTMGTALSIYVPFPDYYTDAKTCLNSCCNTHLWCGGSSSYVMALRMGGEAPHLGMILKEGSLKGYSVERVTSTSGREENLSNQRGTFLLHPENIHLRPGESYTLAWDLFWFQNKEEFEKIISDYTRFICVKSDAFVLLGKEKLSFEVTVGKTKDCPSGFTVLRSGKDVPYSWKEGKAIVEEIPEHTGEYNYEIKLGNIYTRASFLVMPVLDELAESRCSFITEHQQCHNTDSRLNGAYLIYDNEEKQQYYEHKNDHNGGRERIGMGLLLAVYLQKHPSSRLQVSLEAYIDYVVRELFDEKTGTVYNDVGRNMDTCRLYNYPWMSRLFLEMYHLKKESRFLDWYYKSMEVFYRAGGSRFYAIGIPMLESYHTFLEAGRKREADCLMNYYREHGDFILACGKNYPAHEVDYEQSIVAPAAIYMCELYGLTNEEKYRQAAREQLEVLDLFQGFQPDYHMNEVAIRHWDGYWFGKRGCLGDTFPHYWSALSGYAYCNTGNIPGSDRFRKKAERTLRGVLSLFKEDGSASCAMVYPMSVNGRSAAFYDPWANDQDWGLYFNLKYS